MAIFQPFSFLTDLASKATDVGKKVVSEIKEGAQAFPFSQSLAGRGISALGGFVGQQTQRLGANILTGADVLGDTLRGARSKEPAPNFTTISGQQVFVPPPQQITPTQTRDIRTIGSPLFTPVGGIGSTHIDAQGNAYRFDGQKWTQIATGAIPASFPPSGGIPPIPTGPEPPFPPPPPPAPSGPIYTPFYNPETTIVGPGGEILTGFGGFGGISAGQFGFGTGISGAAGGAQALPSGLSSPFRTTGGLPFIEGEEEKRRRKQTVQTYTVQQGDTLNAIANRLGIDPSQISGFASGNPNLIRPGETLNIQGGFQTTQPSFAFQSGQLPSTITNAPAPNFQPISGPPVYVPPPTTTPSEVNLEALQRSIGFRQPEVFQGTVPGLLQNFGVTRTFNRVGSDVYETTGGQVTYVPPQRLAEVGISGPNIGQLRELNTVDLSESQKQMANRIAEQQGKVKPFPSAVQEPTGPVIQPDFAEQRITDQNKETEKGYDSYSTEQLNYYKNQQQPNPNTLTPDTQSNGFNRYYKNFNEQTNEWEVVDSQTGNKLGPGIQADLGLKIADLNTAEGLQALGKGDISLESILGFDPTKQIVSKNAELQKQADDLAKLMKDIITRDPFNGQTITQVRNQLTGEVGLDEEYNNRLKNIKETNEVKNSFDVLRADIEDDPDFSKRSKVLRVDFLTTKTQRLLDTLVRERELIDARITQAEKTVTTRMGDMVTQYNIYRNQVNDIQSEYDKITGRIDKVSENAQQTFQTLALNPELLKGITQSEIAFIRDNGYIPSSLINRISTTSKEKPWSVIENELTGDVYVVTKSGIEWKGNVGPSKTDVSEASPYTNVQFKDNGDGTFTAIGISKATGLPTLIGTPIEAGKTSPEFQQKQFFAWARENPRAFAKDQLMGVVAQIPGWANANITENKPLFDFIDSMKRRPLIDLPSKSEDDPYTSFTNFVATQPTTSNGQGNQFVNINGQQVLVGSIIINDRGQRGRVEANGSITPL